VHVSETTLAIELPDDTRTVRRTTTQPVPSIKAARPRKAAHVSRAPVKDVLAQKRQASRKTRQCVLALVLLRLMVDTAASVDGRHDQSGVVLVMRLAARECVRLDLVPAGRGVGNRW
jgi:hypothetical protein